MVLVDALGDEMPAVVIEVSSTSVKVLVDASELTQFDARFVATIEPNGVVRVERPGIRGNELWFEGFGCSSDQAYAEAISLLSLRWNDFAFADLKALDGGTFPNAEFVQLWVVDPSAVKVELPGNLSKLTGDTCDDVGPSVGKFFPIDLVSENIHDEVGFQPPFTLELQ